MPVTPPPLTFDSPQCGWRKTTAPKIDALRPSELFTCCSECGNRDLIVTYRHTLGRMADPPARTLGEPQVAHEALTAKAQPSGNRPLAT